MKKSLVTIGLAALLLALTSCATQEEPAPSPSPSASPTATASPTAAPEITQQPETTGGPEETGSLTTNAASTGPTTPEEARKAAQDIKAELVRLSEVEDAQVVVAGHSAAVALKFDSQYQGGVDERMKEMVEERIKGVISGITHVVITSDADLMEQLKTLADKLDGAADMAEVESELEAIIKKMEPAKA